MDLSKTLQQLYAQKAKLESVIAALEELVAARERTSAPDPGKRPGRKAMGAVERQQVSERMKRYWANRQQGTSVKD
jgi:hypothetical protein